MEKLLQWRSLADKFYGEDFWSWIFDNQNGQNAQNKQPFSTNDMNTIPKEQKGKFPLVDIYMNDNEVIVVIELPGLSKEDVLLAISGETLKIKGNIKLLDSPDKKIKGERYSGAFERTIDLPETIIKDRASAKFINGLLYVRLPREELADVKQIKID